MNGRSSALNAAASESQRIGRRKTSKERGYGPFIMTQGTDPTLNEVTKRRRIYNETHCANEVSKVPKTAHFAVLCNESITYDDGYGDHGSASLSTHTYIGYIFFESDEALEAWILENYQKKTFQVVKVTPVQYEMKTTLKFG
jgi:hypothetical protein